MYAEVEAQRSDLCSKEQTYVKKINKFISKYKQKAKTEEIKEEWKGGQQLYLFPKNIMTESGNNFAWEALVEVIWFGPLLKEGSM